MSCSPESKEILEAATEYAIEALAEDPVAIDVTEHMPFADAFLIVSADNPRHLRAVRDEVAERLHREKGLAVSVEGSDDSDWILIDGGVVMVHVMLPEARDYYGLEKLWGHSPRLSLKQLSA